MARLFPLWVIVALPWITALALLLLARAQVRLLGPRKAASFAHYLGLGASALALLFTIQAIDQLMAPDDPRALAHTPLAELLGPIVLGPVRVELTLVADRLSSCVALVLAGGWTLARMFMAGPAGMRDLGLGPARAGERDDADPDAAALAIRRLGLLGLIEGAAALVVLASDLGLAAFGWVLLGLGAAVAVAREVDDERRASAATRVLVVGLASDLALGATMVVLVVAGIGLAHTEIWAPLTGDRLYATGLLGLPTAELAAALLVSAASLRVASMAWAGNSLAEALLDALALPVPAVYLLLRYQRVLAYAPTVLALCLVAGLILAVVAVGVALARPARGLGRRGARPGGELGLAGTSLAWFGLVLMAVGVGAWRTAALLILAHALGRLGLRLALLVGDGEQLPAWTAQVARVLAWAAAGIGPGLAYVALAQTTLDVLTRASVVARWLSWPAAAIVILVGFAHAAAIARIWFEHLAPKPSSRRELDEDGLDFAPLAVIVVGLVGLGAVSLAAWFGVTESILRWLDLVLPLAGGHANAPLGPRPEFRDGVAIAHSWVAGSAAVVALVTGFAWMWARERFHRAHGGELAGLRRAVEVVLAGPRRLVWATALVLAGLTELAARGIGRGLLEEGPRIAASLGRDAQAGLGPRLRALDLGGARQALLGIVVGLALVLGWLYAKPEVASVGPSDGYGFGGLRPKLIRAGGRKSSASRDSGSPSASGSSSPGAVDEPPAVADDPAAIGEPLSTPVAPTPLGPRRDRAEPAPIGPDPEVAP